MPSSKSDEAFKVTGQLVLKGVSRMPAFRRKEIAKWLKKQADAVMKDGPDYASTYRAVYRTYTD